MEIVFRIVFALFITVVVLVDIKLLKVQMFVGDWSGAMLVIILGIAAVAILAFGIFDGMFDL